MDSISIGPMGEGEYFTAGIQPNLYWKKTDTLPGFTLPSLTAGSVLFSNGTTVAQDNANFFWDDTNNRLGIGTNSPTEKLDVAGNILLPKTGTATVGTPTYNSREFKLQGSQWFTSGSVAKTLTGGFTLKPRNPGAIVTSTLDFGYAIDSSTERAVMSYKVGDHYNDGFAGQLTLRSGYSDGSDFATGYGSTFGGTIETQYDGTFAFRPVGASGTDFSGIRALSFGTHPTYASFWSRWGFGGGSSYDADIRANFNSSVNIGAGQPAWHPTPGVGAMGSELLNVTIDTLITGNDASRPGLKIVKATEQLRLGYNASNYLKLTTASGGTTTIDGAGGTQKALAFASGLFLGFYGVTPVAQPTGWSTSNVPSQLRTFDYNTMTGAELIEFVSTLMDDHKLTGILGA